MKELSIKEKAQRYDEALDRAKNIKTGKCETTFIFTEGLFNYLFPELEECNEEEVKKAMIDFFKHEREEGVVVSHYGVNIERMIAWLEKQGQVNETIISQHENKICKENNDSLTSEDERIRKALINGFNKLDKSAVWYNGITNGQILAWLEKQGEQKPAVDTKVIIPKFRVGDIVKSKSQPMLSPSKITSIGKDCYYCDDGCIGFAWEDDCEIVEQKPVISDDALREGIAHFGITQYQIDNWLKKYVDVEKQGEQNLNMAKSPQLGKQKPVNNNELKFKVGDWVVVDGITQKVTHIQTDGFDTDRAWNGKSTFNDVHLWTIADVKDCDVLVDVYGNIGIYKSHDDFSWLSYCSLGYYGGFQYFTIEHDNEKTYPATKEQQDTLFAKMRESGYEWDAEKKELKKISQRMISAEAKEAMYGNPAWSEEDEKMVNNILTPLAGRFPWNIYQPMYDWLKSLKDRIGG